MAKIQHRSYAEALKTLLELADKHSGAPANDSESAVDDEVVDLEHALGCVTAENVYSKSRMPPYDNSAMDGFAVSSVDVHTASERNPITLRMLASIAAGDIPLPIDAVQEVEGTCYRINTGAPFPCNARYDACVPMERIRILERDQIAVEKPTRASQHRRLAGEDFDINHQLVQKNTRVTPGHIAVLAAAGIYSLRVRRHLRIAILSTGKELQSPPKEDHHGDEISRRGTCAGQIWNSNGPYLRAALLDAGFRDVALLKNVGDDPKEYIRRIESEVITSFDVLLTTGGVSKGEYDYVEPALRTMGANIVFHGVGMRPGHPVLAAEFAQQCPTKPGLIIFGLPGNPSAAAACLRFLVMPYLRSRMGLQQEKPVGFAQIAIGDQTAQQLASACHSAQIDSRHIGATGVTSFFLAKLEMPVEPGQVAQARLLSRGSGMVSPMADGDCWVKVDGVVDTAEGTLLPCYSSSNSM